MPPQAFLTSIESDSFPSDDDDNDGRGEGKHDRLRDPHKDPKIKWPSSYDSRGFGQRFVVVPRRVQGEPRLPHLQANVSSATRPSTDTSSLSQSSTAQARSTAFNSIERSNHPHRIGKDVNERVSVRIHDIEQHLIGRPHAAPLSAVDAASAAKSSVTTSAPDLPASDSGIHSAKWNVPNAGLDPKGSLDPRYKVRPSSFYTVGRVFALVWHENFGNSPNASASDWDRVYTGRYGEPIYSSIRRMVVVRHGHGYCVCIPIHSYGNRGLLKFKDSPSTVELHSIIHTTDKGPTWLKGEPQSSKQHIRVKRAASEHHLDESSRLCYYRPHTVEHTVKSMDVGMVTKNSLRHVLRYFQAANQVA